ncbi:DUF4192 domain-containing protein [Nocardia sp. NPDC050712]|uniref:DUF4192 domain-containing protein n=1 Tax=Nocardia sp. NPDC050712 TaxID=3155518 RepID=UPI0033CFD0EC
MDPTRHFQSPGHLIAVVPELLGHPIPERALLIVTLRERPKLDGLVIKAISVELPPTPIYQCENKIARCVSQACAEDDVKVALAVLVDPYAIWSTAAGNEKGWPRLLLASIQQHCQTIDTDLSGAWAVPRIEPGVQWWTLLGPVRCGQVQPAPTADCEMADVHMVRLAQESPAGQALAIADTDTLAQVGAAFLTALNAVIQRAQDVEATKSVTEHRRAELDRVLQSITGPGEQVLKMTVMAEIGVALLVPQVSDALVAMPLTVHAEAAERLWAQLVPVLPDVARAEAAVLLAVSAYMRGDRELAQRALRTAQLANPHLRIAPLLERAWSVPMTTEEMREICRDGVEVAAELGAHLELEDSDTTGAQS